MKLVDSFYQGNDVLSISNKLIGKYLFTRLPLEVAGKAFQKSPLTGGIIVETEAYAGPQDKASHAYNNRRTARTEIMYRQGGVAYIYLCYGIHSLLNIITNVEGIPHAVLIRAIEPAYGIKHMLQRRCMQEKQRRMTAGPGALTKAFGITTEYNGIKLTGNRIWIEERPRLNCSHKIISSPRIGVDYAGIDAEKPWRFRLKNNPWTSPAK